MRTRLVAAGLATLAMCTAGCGTTLQRRTGAVTVGSDGVSGPAGSTGSTASGAGSTSDTSAASPTGATGGSGATPGGPTDTSGSSAIATDLTSAADAGKAPGRTTVRLGVVYLKGLEAAYAAIGAKNSTVDSHADTQAVVNDINAHGGVAGRKIETSYYAIDASSTTDRATQLQAACAFFATDHPVDLVASYTGGALVSCLGAHHIPLVNGWPGSEVAASHFDSAPLYAEPAGLSLDRLAQLEPAFLASRHWIDGRWGSGSQCAAVRVPRVGIVTVDDADHHAVVDRVMTPALKAIGHAPTDVVYLNASGNTATALANASAGIQNAVLRFSSDCVDHVVFMSAVAVDGLFMLQASQQHYTPRYGFTSQEAPVIAIPNVPDYKAQMRGSIGVGWSPFDDVLIRDFDPAASAPARRCLQVLSKAGVAPVDNNSTVLALPSCETVYFAAAVFARMLAPSGGGYLQVVNSLAGGYQPSGTYAADFTTTRHDAVAAYREFDFQDGCGCFRYTSGPQSF